jgi:DNA mismatch endonuclease, patch repair protein
LGDSDVFTREKRSAVMAAIRSTGNRDTELRMIALFRVAKLTGWRRNAKMFGKPDFIFPKERIALFVDGCFWHRHSGCRFSYTPKRRLHFWLSKFDKNVARDRLVTRTLRKAGWRVLRIWECDLGPRRQHRVINRVRRTLDFAPPEEKQSSKKLKILR